METLKIPPLADNRRIGFSQVVNTEQPLETDVSVVISLLKIMRVA